jgi:hypothetical protein
MRAQRADSPRHPGITFHKMPVGAGFPGFVFAAGIVAIALLGLPGAKWFLLASVIAGVVVLGIIRLLRRLRSRTEEEEFQLNVGRQRNWLASNIGLEELQKSCEWSCCFFWSE